MKSGELKRAKRSVRTQVRTMRDAIPAAERVRRSALVIERLLKLPQVERARVMMAFSSFGSEIDTAPLLRELHARGCVVALPRTVAGEIEPCAYQPGDPLDPTPFGVLEPIAGRPIDPADVDVVVTPAVAFDRTGRRVGYGGGFYDRFLGRTRPDALRVGIGFAVQLVDDRLPGGPFDLAVDLIVTEEGVVRCRRED